MKRTSPDSYYSTSLERGLKVLAIFAGGRTSISLTEISRQLQLNKTSSFRFTNTLVRLNFLKKDPKTKQLKLGLKAFALGQDLIRSYDLIQIIRPMVDESFDKHNCTIDVALLHSDVLLVVYRREAKDTLIFQSPTVMKDLHALALGKAVLAYLSADELSRFLDKDELTRRTSNTITTKSSLLIDLKEITERGYSINNEEYILGLISVGAPLISSYSNRVVGSISFDFSKAQHSLRSIRRNYIDGLVKLAEDISQFIPMGYI